MSQKFTIMVAVEFDGIDPADVDAQEIIIERVNAATEDLHNRLQQTLPAHVRDLIDVSVQA